MTFKECMEIGKECGLTTIDECVLNIELHYDTFFRISNLAEEMNAFYKDIEANEPEWFHKHYFVKKAEKQGLTLEEAIKHCREKAEQLTTASGEAELQGCDREALKCSKCADEHRQLAVWLSQLKDIKDLYEKWNTYRMDDNAFTLGVNKILGEQGQGHYEYLLHGANSLVKENPEVLDALS